ncbi:MAG TPA: presqualene diphosphate synthase HpnD [Vicinamibacterales bacterium]|nr:presqualene diphosphate synthase HpnD [Vicinamibacterales bacterium]
MSRNTSFYYSFLVLPPRKREAIIAIWDFCRVVDDAVDEAPPVGTPGRREQIAESLAGWRRELARCYDGQPPATPIGQQLQPFVREFNLPRQAFEDVIDGVEMDIDPRRYATFEDLYEYCRRVASAVGLICIEVFGYRDVATRQYALDLGIALQLTNIIRDVTTDLSNGRVYLPLEDLTRFACTEDDLRAGATDKVRGLLQFECERARSYYQRARRERPRADRRGLVAAQIMGAIYVRILRRVERAGYDVFTRRIRVPRPQQAMIAIATWAATMAGF